MNITIIGAGAIGTIITYLCSKSPTIQKITIADKSRSKLRQIEKLVPQKSKIVITLINPKKIRPYKGAIVGSQIVLNSASPKLNMKIAQECILQKASYIDLDSEVLHYRGMPSDATLFKLRNLHKEFKKNGCVAITNAGLSPGLTDIFASKIIKKLVKNKIKKIDEINIRFADIICSEKLVSSWSPEVLLFESIKPPTVWKKGKIIELYSKRPENYTFHFPIGAKKTFLLSGHPDIYTIPEGSPIPIEYIDLKATFETGGHTIEEILKKYTKKTLLDYNKLSKMFAPPNHFDKYVKKGIITDEFGELDIIIKYNKNKKIKISLMTNLTDIKQLVPFGNVASVSTALLPTVLILLLSEKKISKKGVVTCSQIGKENLIIQKIKDFGLKLKMTGD